MGYADPELLDVDGLSLAGVGYADPEPGLVGVDVPGYADPDGVSGATRLAHSLVLCADDGGQVLTLIADWPAGMQALVHLVDPWSGQTFPEPGASGYGQGAGCMAPLALDDFGQVVARSAQQRTLCLPVGRALSFVAPPCPVGLYDVRVSWGGGELILPGVVQVRHRGHFGATYRVRRTLPERVFDAGAAWAAPLLPQSPW